MLMFSKEFQERINRIVFRIDGFDAKNTAPETEKVLSDMLDDAEANHKGTVRQAAVHDIVCSVVARYS